MKTFDDVNLFLEQFVPGSILNGDFYNPEKMFTILPLIGSPEQCYKIIHVAGTSGKTSTAYFITAMLAKSGAKVGLTVSPHIDTINERLQINGTPLSEEAFCELFSRFVTIPGLVELRPTYFELLVAFAFWAFRECGCTHVVIEVGLGGLKDATNAVESADKVAVITDIGFDHTHILGDTLEKIARNKAGIIKAQNHVFTYEQDSVINGVIDVVAAQQHATVHRYSQVDLERTAKFVDRTPAYQKRNWLLARQVADYVIERDDLQKISELEMQETQHMVIPARMQTINIGKRTLILDGAHNPQKLNALVTSIQRLYPKRSVVALVSFGIAKTEALQENFAIIKKITNDVIVTQFSLQEDLAHRSVDVELLYKVAIDADMHDVRRESDPQKAFDVLLEQKTDILLVTGSFYLISVLQSKIKEIL